MTRQRDATADELIKSGSRVISIDPQEVQLMKGSIKRSVMEVNDLMESIANEGQIHPIVVRQARQHEGNLLKTVYVLISGRRRLKACQELGKEVQALVAKPRDMLHLLDLQLAENVHRKGFDIMETASALAMRKEAYEKKHPETAQGGAGKGRTKGDAAPERFCAVMSKKLGVNERTIYRLLEVDGLPGDVKQQLEALETSEERNNLIREAIRQQGKDRKKQKLHESAAAIQEQRQQELEAEASQDEEENVPPPEGPKPKKTKKATKKDPVEKKPTKKSKAISDKTVAIFHNTWEDGVESKLKTGTVDLILTDPPYSLERSGVMHSKRSSINADKVDWDQLDVGWVLQLAERLADGGQIVAFCPAEAIGNYKEVFLVAGLDYRGHIAMHKTNPGVLHRDNEYLSSMEYIVWAVKGDKPSYFEPWDNKGAKAVHNFREGPICGGNERFDHPAQKPLWIIEDLLLRHSAEGFRVLDPFAGVGTTLVACKKHGRYALGFEKDKEYYKIAKDRLEVVQ